MRGSIIINDKQIRQEIKKEAIQLQQKLEIFLSKNPNVDNFKIYSNINNSLKGLLAEFDSIATDLLITTRETYKSINIEIDKLV